MPRFNRFVRYHWREIIAGRDYLMISRGLGFLEIF